MAFSDIYLTNNELKTLKLIYRDRRVNSEIASRLEGLGFVVIMRYSKNMKFAYCEIKNNGLRYLEYSNDLRADRRWTRIVAVISLVISALALLVSIFNGSVS